MTLDLDKLEQLARAARDSTGETSDYGMVTAERGELIFALSPDVVLALVARLRFAEAVCIYTERGNERMARGSLLAWRAEVDGAGPRGNPKPR